VTFNPGFSYDYYRPRVYKLEEAGHDPTDFDAAWQHALEWPAHDDRIPIGVFRNIDRPAYWERLPVLHDGGPLVKQTRTWDEAAYDRLRANFI
ncbi:MAG: 2-oxoacid:ferredoxin oxidoreductase subunit beta, partial [Chloroflexi bacterium]|nr:2-oxoacid:ferredoxin oxidoreductase subunit beta [Chloroflexota bacterium]